MDDIPVLKYLGLSPDYEPSPSGSPTEFLKQNIRYLPPPLLSLFSSRMTPKQRTEVSAIRNRRLRYFDSGQAEFSFQTARTTWPSLWQGQEIRDQIQAEGNDEKEWANKEFLGGAKQEVGKLGTLLGEYQQERESERLRTVRNQQREYEEHIPEEEDSDEEEFAKAAEAAAAEHMSPEEARELFLRRIKERFIYGLLDNVDYDKVDWDEKWDVGVERDDEERWFDEEEESDALEAGIDSEEYGNMTT